jgi:hypothetical protein
MLDSSIFTRYIAAGSPFTPPIVLMRLAADKCEAVRRRVAENSHAPAEILSLLAHDASADVRIGLADNAAAPRSVLTVLAQDACDDVRYALAENANTPAELLTILAADTNPYVAWRAQTTLNRAFGQAAGGLSQLVPQPALPDKQEAAG